jgi:pimeloyl-ACP methyl ester carboxylesterase
MEPCPIPDTEEEARCGTYTVYENRALGSGRTIDINIIVIPARSESPRPDPIVPLSGGPGGAATTGARGWSRSSFRRERDIVLVDQRGTGRSNPLYCEVAVEGDLQSYLDPAFTAEKFERCRERLEPLADLTQYTTPDFADEVRTERGRPWSICAGTPRRYAPRYSTALRPSRSATRCTTPTNRRRRWR